MDPDMEVSSGEESPGSPRSDASRERSASTTVPIELFRQQLENNKQLQDELAKLNATIAELRRELQELRRGATTKPGKRKKPRIIGSSSSSSEEDEPRPPPAAKDPIEPTQEPMDEAPPALTEETPQVPTQEVPPAPTEEAQKSPKIPPVILRKQERWTAVSRTLDARSIRYTRAKLIGDGITITPSTATDFRKMTALFNNTGEEYHTYSLAEDRQLRVVVRGLPTGVPLQEIQEDLREQGFPDARAQRMTSRRTKQAMPLVLVQVPQSQTAILDLKRCCSLVVRVERQRAQQQASQCHRCQRFGHGQSRCTAAPKCVKCGQEHATATCTKPREEPAKCANCGGDHPASYRGCPKFPKAKKAPTPTEVKRKPEAEKRTPAQAPRPATTSGVSYAQAAAGKKTAPKKTAPPTAGGKQQETMERALAQFQQQIQQQMLEMFKTMVAKLPSLIQV